MDDIAAHTIFIDLFWERLFACIPFWGFVLALHTEEPAMSGDLAHRVIPGASRTFQNDLPRAEETCIHFSQSVNVALHLLDPLSGDCLHPKMSGGRHGTNKRSYSDYPYNTRGSGYRPTAGEDEHGAAGVVPPPPPVPAPPAGPPPHPKGHGGMGSKASSSAQAPTNVGAQPSASSASAPSIFGAPSTVTAPSIFGAPCSQSIPVAPESTPA
eukprot:1489896-Amphidinium_carterae.1